MTTSEYSKYLCGDFDSRLQEIAHYTKYPQMLPWIGKNYAAHRILVFGESHYLPCASTLHRSISAWYDGVELDKTEIGWTKTRGTIGNGIVKKWNDKSKAIYKNIEKALYESGAVNGELPTAFTEIAFMNFFQRPANYKKSIKANSKDAEMANATSEKVVDIIQPSIVIFTSSKAYKHAKLLRHTLNEKTIEHTKCPHPGSAWWNRATKKYKNKTGKNNFIAFVKDHVK